MTHAHNPHTREFQTTLEHTRPYFKRNSPVDLDSPVSIRALMTLHEKSKFLWSNAFKWIDFLKNKITKCGALQTKSSAECSRIMPLVSLAWLACISTYAIWPISTAQFLHMQNWNGTVYTSPRYWEADCWTVQCHLLWTWLLNWLRTWHFLL